MSSGARRITDRTLLRFSDEVRTSFAFLEALGFHCVRAEATFVLFESSTFAINIFHGLQSYEIGLDVADAQASDTYSFSEILRLLNREEAEQYRDYATHTADGVAEAVRRLAELFRKCFDAGILEDKGQLFCRLQSQRHGIARNRALEVQLEQARIKCEDAWRKKDFVEIVKILAPLREHLSSVELNRLEYARKQL